MPAEDAGLRNMPRIRDDLYVPPSDPTLDLITSAARRQYQLQRDLGDIRAQGIQQMWQAPVQAYGAYQQGKQQRLAEDEAKQIMGSRAQEMEQTSRKMKTEEERQAYLHETDQASGKPRWQALAEEEHAFTGKAREAELKQADLNAKVSLSQLNLQGIEARNAQEKMMMDKASFAYAGAFSDTDPTKQQANVAKIDAMFQGKLDPAMLGALKNSAAMTVNSSRNQAALSQQIALQGTEPYQNMTGITGSISGHAAGVQQLNALKGQYNANLRPGGAVLGAAGGESAEAEAARQQFATTLDNMGEHDLANNVREGSFRGVSERMNAAINIASQKLGQEQQFGMGQINPTLQSRPEVYQANVAAVKAMNAAATGKNNIDLTRTGGQIPGAGAGANGAFLTGAGAVAHQPYGGMNQAMPFNAMPTSSGSLNLPGMQQQPQGAMPGPAQGAALPKPQMAPGAPQPNPYGWDFSKHKINPQMPAQQVPQP